MPRTHRLFATALLAAALLVPALAPADEPTGVRKEYIGSLDDAGGKLIELAQAMPQRKYTWKPGKDVRSTAEVYLHVVAANYGIPMFIGATLPADGPVNTRNLSTLEKSTTDKAKIVQLLKDSFEHARQVVADTPDSDLDTMAEVFGTKMTKRAALLIVVNHAHEHLGQSIAYARINGVTPPWTAREQAAAKAKAAGQKSAGGK